MPLFHAAFPAMAFLSCTSTALSAYCLQDETKTNTEVVSLSALTDWALAGPGLSGTKVLDISSLRDPGGEASMEDVFFTVDVDGAFRGEGDRRSNLKAYPDKAVAWVRTVKDSGHRVRFWEVDNEPYPARIPLVLTEWSVPNEKQHGRLTELENRLGIAIQLGNNAAGTIDDVPAKSIGFSTFAQ